jgi:hypothetical protein
VQVVFLSFLNILSNRLSGEKSEWEFEVLDLRLVTLKSDVWSSNNGIEINTEEWGFSKLIARSSFVSIESSKLLLVQIEAA